ncbi:MAG: GGDEF domain-containing protein [Candidatus Omnitrophica bacterium]|nr:GGDEF domain-containing protein [Candidatus Omnitrophota bacterium]
MEERKLIIRLSEILLFIVFTTVLFYAFAFSEPLKPLKLILKEMLPSLGITLFFLFLCFRTIEYYHNQILKQKKLNEELNDSLFKLSSDLKIEKLLQNSLEILMKFYEGDIGILSIIGDDLKKFVSTDVITININNKSNIERFEKNKNCVYVTISPDKISVKEENLIKKLINEYGLQSCMGIIVFPIYTEKVTKAIGIIGIYKKKKKEILRDISKIKIISEVFMQHLNLEIENSLLNEKLNYASITDALTEVYNRRYFNIRLKEEFARAKREGYPVSIMISDLDNFKKYVDTYGHPMGDIILKELANLLKYSIRETDILCRFGGDEFAYILPFTPSKEAQIVAERLKSNVENYRFLKEYINDKDVKLTLSIGIATFPEHGNTEEEILSKADNALFQAKNIGKNLVIVYSENGGTK